MIDLIQFVLIAALGGGIWWQRRETQRAAAAAAGRRAARLEDMAARLAAGGGKDSPGRELLRARLAAQSPRPSRYRVGHRVTHYHPIWLLLAWWWR